MLAKAIKAVANRLGYEIHIALKEGGLLGYDLELDANQTISIIRENSLLPKPRLITLYQQVVFCEMQQIPGAYVECGVWKGGAVGLMALGNLKWGSKRRHLHLFDSFEGIPEPNGSIDGQKAVELARQAGGDVSGKLRPLKNAFGSVGTLEINKKLLEQQIGYDPAYIHYHRGWFQDTLPEESKNVGEIAILRLDGDWYESQKICLQNLYDSVVSGGFIIIDDYGWFEGDRKAVDEFMDDRGIKAFLHHIDNAGRYWVKP